MSEILNELKKTMESIPKSPLNGRIVFIPAKWEMRGEMRLRLIPVNEMFERVEENCIRLGIEYQLSSHVPTTDKDGKDVVYTIKKPHSSPHFMFGEKILGEKIIKI